MIIKLHGETSLNKLPRIIRDLITDIQHRAGLEESKFTVKDLQVGILFNVNGEKMLLNSDAGGVIEPFEVHVELDEKGNIKRMVDNENESFLDEYSKAMSVGHDTPDYAEIESIFDNDDLIWEHEENGGDMKAIHYRIHNTDEMVVRYYKNDILVGETGYKKKEA